MKYNARDYRVQNEDENLKLQRLKKKKTCFLVTLRSKNKSIECWSSENLGKSLRSEGSIARKTVRNQNREIQITQNCVLSVGEVLWKAKQSKQSKQTNQLRSPRPRGTLRGQRQFLKIDIHKAWKIHKAQQLQVKICVLPCAATLGTCTALQHVALSRSVTRKWIKSCTAAGRCKLACEHSPECWVAAKQIGSKAVSEVHDL